MLILGWVQYNGYAYTQVCEIVAYFCCVASTKNYIPVYGIANK